MDRITNWSAPEAMTPSDDLDDPFLGSPASRGPSFWSTVRWRVRLGIVLCVLVGLIVYIHSSIEARQSGDVPWLTGGCVVGMAVLWFGARILWAWLEWPSENRIVRGLKSVIRYFGFDAASERQHVVRRRRLR
jgi:hypothetical protein